MPVSWETVSAWRLARHHVTEPAPARRWLDVVARIGGLHAQVMSAAEQAIAVRTEGLPPARVSNALWRQRTLVKCWAMRGTLHLVPARDYPTLIAALSTLRHFRRPSWLKYFEVSHDDLDRIIAGAGAILGDRGLTREELADRLAKHARKPGLERSLLSGWGVLLKPAAFQGKLCFGPSDGQRVTFVQPERWLGGFALPDPAASLAAVARRYLGAYGPARSDDFSRWLGVDVATAKRVFNGLGDRLVEVDVEGWKGKLLAEDLDELTAAEPASGVALLPYFDPYTVAVAKQAGFLFPARYRAQVYRTAGWISPVLLVDGRIAGVWDQARDSKGGLIVSVAPFGRLPAARRPAVEGAARRLAGDRPVRVAWGT